MKFLFISLIILIVSLSPTFAFKPINQSDFSMMENMTGEYGQSDFPSNETRGTKLSDFPDDSSDDPAFKIAPSDFPDNEIGDDSRQFGKQSDFPGNETATNQSNFGMTGNVTPEDFPDSSSEDDDSKQSDFPGEGTAEPSDFPDNETEKDARQSDFFGDETGAAEPSDFPDDTSDQVEQSDFPDNSSDDPSQASSSLAFDVAQVLMTLTADEIPEYGLSDYSDYTIKESLELLNVGNLTKVLQNIPPEELSLIKDMLTPDTFNEILSKVPEPQRDEIKNKISTE